jgi:hypothetical protein
MSGQGWVSIFRKTSLPSSHTNKHTHTQIEDWSVVLDIPQRTCAKKKKSDFPA